MQYCWLCASSNYVSTLHTAKSCLHNIIFLCCCFFLHLLSALCWNTFSRCVTSLSELILWGLTFSVFSRDILLLDIFLLPRLFFLSVHAEKISRDKTMADWYRIEESDWTWSQQSNVREKRLWRRGERAGSLCFTTEYLPRTSFSLFQLSPPKTDPCRREGGTQLRPRMSPTGPVSLDKQWISATAALLCLRDRALLCLVEEAPAVLLL